jgi:septal ring factor EnvC (AmiA/AmiB activator)
MSSVTFQKLFLYTLFFLCSTTLANTAQQQLTKVDSAINQTQESITTQKNHLEGIQYELQRTETVMSQYYSKLAQTNVSLKKINLIIKQLQTQLDRLQQERDQQVQALSAQMKTQYMIGQKHPLKNLLNNENNSQIDRINKYADILSKNRLMILDSLKETEASLDQQKMRLQKEKNELSALQEQQQIAQQQLQNQYQQRQKLVVELDRNIHEDQQNLHSLVTNKKQLQNVLSRLQKISTYSGQTFGKHHGHLPWPIEGKIITRYGESIKDSQLKTSGIVISAKSGNTVHAIAPGKVVFADWMPGLGFVMIIDHGQSYMSLYGHNQRLLLAVDTIVETGDEIATVGDSGGQSQPGLYFAIRHQGKPINPLDWLL